MEIISVLGIIVGFVAIIGAMIFKHIPFSVFLNPAALLVILLGTVATVLNSFTGHELKNLGALFRIIFTKQKSSSGNAVKIIETMVDLATDARKEGILSIEAKLVNINDPFMQKGLKMVVDGMSDDYILDVLTSEIDAMRARHSLNASIFSSAGTYAPTLGVLGAVFGLIAAMSNIQDVQAMSEAVAAAFIATILGIFTGYVLWNPFATKLKTKSKHEVQEKIMIIEGLLSLKKGDPPIKLKEKLVALLPGRQQLLLDDDKGRW